MAAFRSTYILLKSSSSAMQIGIRLASTRTSSGNRKTVSFLVGAIAAGAVGFGTYKVTGGYQFLSSYVEQAVKAVQNATPINTVSAACVPPSQPSVYSYGKDHALYLWIYLKPTANPREVARAVSKLQQYVDLLVEPCSRNDENEILAGVGFGPNLYSQVGGRTRENFVYRWRKGLLGDMPSSGGDLFIHAKSHQLSKLFELCQMLLNKLPKDSVESFEDIYSFCYREGRDLSGFRYGTENPRCEDERHSIAVEKCTGGSYVVTQKWIHNLNVINCEKDKVLETWVGRTRKDSTELTRKSITSHVARMTGTNAYQSQKACQIVRQSMVFGTHAGEAGLFFIGYAASPRNFEFMLDRMVGAGEDSHCDDIMRIARNVKGTYWYFPGTAELKKLE